jgi:hypothetical protein
MAGHPIPGWAPTDERTLSGDPARRPVGAVVGDAFGLYRDRWRSVLGLAALVEVPLGLLSLPYLVRSFDAWTAMVGSFGELASSPGDVEAWFDRVRDTYAALFEPTIVLAGALTTASPIISVVLLSAVIGGLLLGSPTATIAAALRALARRIVPIAALCLLVLAASVAVMALTTAVARSAFETPFDRAPSGWTIVLSIGWLPVLLVAGYLGVRWAVAIQSLVLEPRGLIDAFRWSQVLTRRRVQHVFVCLLIGVVIVAVANTGLSFMLFATAILGGVTTNPLLAAILLVGYLAIQVLAAPVLPLLTTVLYRDMRVAGPR